MAALNNDLNPENNFLEGQHFIIGTLNVPPFVSYTDVSKDGKINDISGFIYQIIIYLATKYQFNFEYVKSRDGNYGALLPNGSWNGLVGMLHRGEVDLVATGFVVSYSRSQVIDFTVQYYNDPISLLIPYPELESMSINGIARPFQYQVWILIGITLMAVIIAVWKIFSYALSSFTTMQITNRPSLYQTFWSTFQLNRFVIRMNAITHFLRLPVAILSIVWCFGTFIILNSYSSTLTSYLLIQRYHPMVNSIEDIANMKRPVIMVSKFGSYETTLMEAKSGPLFQLGDSLRKYPELRLNLRDRAVENVVEHRRVFTSGRSILLVMIEEDMKKTGQCRLYLAKEPWGNARFTLGLPKFSPITSIFNRQINWLREVGLLDYWQKKYWPRPNRCTEPLNNKLPKQNQYSKLTLNQLSSAFLFLGCGMAASVIVFIFEKIYFIKTYGCRKNAAAHHDETEAGTSNQDQTEDQTAPRGGNIPNEDHIVSVQGDITSYIPGSIRN